MVNIILNKHWTNSQMVKTNAVLFVGPETASMEPQFWGESPGVNSLWFSWHSQHHNRPQTKKENRQNYMWIMWQKNPERFWICSFKKEVLSYETCTQHYPERHRNAMTCWQNSYGNNKQKQNETNNHPCVSVACPWSTPWALLRDTRCKTSATIR